MPLRWPAQLAATPAPSHTVTPHAVRATTIIHIVHSGASGDATSMLWAAWVTALATAGLLIGAVITAIYAVRAFGQQATDVKLAREQADRDIQERRRAQAAQVFIVTSARPADPVLLVAQASNTSRQPVYDIEVQWRTETALLGQPVAKPQLLPGEIASFTYPWTSSEELSGQPSHSATLQVCTGEAATAGSSSSCAGSLLPPGGAHSRQGTKAATLRSSYPGTSSITNDGSLNGSEPGIPRFTGTCACRESHPRP
jgi:hypothetical protein